MIINFTEEEASIIIDVLEFVTFSHSPFTDELIIFAEKILTDKFRIPKDYYTLSHLLLTNDRIEKTFVTEVDLTSLESTFIVKILNVVLINSNAFKTRVEVDVDSLISKLNALENS